MSPMQRDRYPENWDELRADAVNAAAHRCQGCGAADLEDGTNRTRLTVHHPDRDPENPTPRLVALCAACHLAVEAIARSRDRLHAHALDHACPACDAEVGDRCVEAIAAPPCIPRIQLARTTTPGQLNLEPVG